MSEKVEHTAVKNIDPPRGCTCHPSDVYFPCQQHHAFWICENAWLKQREAALLAERDRLREALKEIQEIIGKRHSISESLNDAQDMLSAIHWMADAALKDTNQ